MYLQNHSLGLGCVINVCVILLGYSKKKETKKAL